MSNVMDKAGKILLIPFTELESLEKIILAHATRYERGIFFILYTHASPAHESPLHGRKPFWRKMVSSI